MKTLAVDLLNWSESYPLSLAVLHCGERQCLAAAEVWQRRWLAFILLGMVKGGKRVFSVTSGQLCRLLSTVWKHPQCLNPNSNCILSGMKQISRSLETSQGRWKGLVCVLWLHRYFVWVTVPQILCFICWICCAVKDAKTKLYKNWFLEFM